MFKSIQNAILFSLSLIVLFNSCKDDFDPTSDLNGSKADIISMLQSEDIVQRASIDSDNFTFVSNVGTIVNAEPNSFEFIADGTLATGMIDFEITELYTKSEILRYGLPTESQGSILESDGEFLFSASQNGEPLRLANNKSINVSVPNSEPNPDMELFRGAEGTWWPSDNPFIILGPDTSEEFEGYGFEFDRLTWVNIDYFTKFDLELTDISICVPDGYQEDNILSWIVFRDIDVVLNSTGQNLPIGEVVSIVVIAAEDEDTFRLDIQEVTIEEGLKVNLDPQEESIDDIIDRLKELD